MSKWKQSAWAQTDARKQPFL